MLTLNEAPDIALHQIQKAKAKNFSRYITGPLILFSTGSVTVGQWHHHDSSSEKIHLKELINALQQLKVKNCDKNTTAPEIIHHQAKEVLRLLSSVYYPLIEYSDYLNAARKKIEEKINKEPEIATTRMMLNTR